MAVKRTDVFVFVILVLTFLIWSNSFIAIGALRAGDKLTSIQLLVARYLPVGVISVAILLAGFRRETANLLKRHALRIALIGTLSVSGYNLALNFGMAYVSAGASSLLVSLTPLLTLLLAVKFLKEPYNFSRVAGTATAFVGLAVVVVFGKVGNQASSVMPLDKMHYAVIVLLASVCWSIATTLSKPLMKHHSPVAVNYLLLAVGSLPLAVFADSELVRKVGSFTRADFLALAFLSIACTVVAFALWFVALKHWKASNVTLFVYLNPPLTAFFDYLFNGRRVTAFFLLGGLLMLAGVMWATVFGTPRTVRGKV